MFYKITALNSLKTLFYLSPLAILIGPFSGDLVISSMAFLFLIIMTYQKKTKYFYNRYTVFFIFFIVYLIISSLISDFKILSLEASLFYFRFYIFSLSVWYLLDEDNIILRKFSIVLLITISFAILNGYFQYFYGQNIFGIVSNSNSRLTLLLSDKLYLGGYITRFLPLCFGLMIVSFYKNWNPYIYALLFFILFISSDILVFITGERTAFLLLIMLTLLFIFLVSSLKAVRIFGFIFSAILIIIISFNSVTLKERNIDHTLRQLGITSDQYSPRHTPLYIGSYLVFKDNIIFGTGPKTYREICKEEQYNIDKYSCSTHSHNTYLQILAETGIIGFAFVFFAFCYVVLKFCRYTINYYIYNKKTLSDFQICLLICFFLTLWPIQPTMSFFSNWINTIYYFPLGFYLYTIYNTQ